MVLPVRAKKIVLASVVVVTVLTLVNYHQIVHFAETALPHRLPEPFTHNHIFCKRGCVYCLGLNLRG